MTNLPSNPGIQPRN